MAKPRIKITFPDVSRADFARRGDHLKVTDFSSDNSPTLHFAAHQAVGAVNGTSNALLNYQQVFKLREVLNTWLASHLNCGPALWEDESD